MHVADGIMVLVRSEGLFGNGMSAPAADVFLDIATLLWLRRLSRTEVTIAGIAE
jgi:hypothetical protein